MIGEALARGWRVNSPRRASERGGVVMIGVEEPAAVAARLRERRVLVDWRPGVGLRLGPHFFNTDDEIHEALEILQGVAG
jgi:kynureninase